MYDKVFKDFRLESKVSPELLAKYEGLLPEEMLAVWREYGFGTILDGYLKIINPDEYRDVLERSYFRADVAVPIFVTAFGDIITWEKNEFIRQVKFNKGDFESITGGFKFFWEDMDNKDIDEIYGRLDKYKAAVKRLGELEFDECFGYTPLLGLGGREKVENLEKVKTKVHIELITQMMGRIE